MSNPTCCRCLLILFLVGICATTHAQAQSELGPPPIPSLLPPPPPDPDTLSTPAPEDWEPLVPKGNDDTTAGTVELGTLSPQSDAPRVPPAPPIPEPMLDAPDTTDVEMPIIEVWRDESEYGQRPARQSNRLVPALVKDGQVSVKVQFDVSKAGKSIFVRPGLGMIIGDQDGSKMLDGNAYCEITAQLGEGYNRSHLIFYCEGVKMVMPVMRASLTAIQTAEGEGH